MKGRKKRKKNILITNYKIYVPEGQEPDKGAIKQMDNCLAVDEAVGGVLSADHHLGYSMPIGGTIAYKDAISPSGVGFDIGCVDKDTEYLSPTGWVKISEYDGGKVAQWNSDGTAEFIKPLHYEVTDAEFFFHLKTKYGINQMLTPGHKMIIWENKSNKWNENHTIISAGDFVNKHNSLKLGHFSNFETSFLIKIDSKIDFTDEQIRVQTMVNADGYIDGHKAVVSVKKDRKKVRCRDLLRRANITYTENDDKKGYTTFRFNPPQVDKSFDHFWKCSYDQLCVISEEVLYWDGNQDNCFYTRSKDSANFINYVFSATGYRSVMRDDIDKSDGKLDYRVYKYEKNRTGMRSSPKEEVKKVPSKDGKAYCFTVPSGFFIMRREGNVVVTGNCGNLAVKVDIKNEEFEGGNGRKYLAEVMDRIGNEISFGIGRPNKDKVDHPVLDEIKTHSDKFIRELYQKSATQLGTVGSGNHYVDLFKGDDGYIWIGVHFGSRGFGHTIASKFIKDDKDMYALPTLLSTDGDEGQTYLGYMKLAGEYAYAGREEVVNKVLNILGNPEVLNTVHNHHNFAWKEDHFGEKVWVVRKGATPLFPGQQGFVGGSMGEDAYIITGASYTASINETFNTWGAGDSALWSAPHGAGRAMSRTEAKGKHRKRWACMRCDYVQKPHTSAPLIDGEPVCPTCGFGDSTIKKIWVETQPGKINWDEVKMELEGSGIELRGGDADEAPEAYKRLPDVLQAHSSYVKVVRTLTPIGVAMAGAGTVDPYKD